MEVAEHIRKQSAIAGRIEWKRRHELLQRAAQIAAEEGVEYDGALKEAEALVIKHDSRAARRRALAKFGTAEGVRRVESASAVGETLCRVGRMLRWVVGVSFLVMVANGSELALPALLVGIGGCVALSLAGRHWPSIVENRVLKAGASPG